MAASSDEPAAVERVGRAVQQVIVVLEAARVPVWAVDHTREQFRATHSREPMAVTPTELDKLPALVRAALDNYAFDQRPLALRQVREIVDTANRAMESLLRDTRVAQQFLDACLLLVRSNIDRGDQDAAMRNAKTCRGLALNVAPSKRRHPPQVLELLRTAEAEMRADANAWLRVTSEPSNCTVFINGRALGTTPYEVQPPPGERRVQVECNPGPTANPGRVHAVRVEQSDVELHIDTAFDAAIRTPDGEPLRLASGAGRAGERDDLRFAAQISDTLGLTHALVVSSSNTDAVVVRSVTPNGSFSAEVGYEPVGGAGDDLAPALDALLRGRNWLRDPTLPNDCAAHVRTLIDTDMGDEAKLLVQRCIAAGRPNPDSISYPPPVTGLYEDVYAELEQARELERKRAAAAASSQAAAPATRRSEPPASKRSWLPPAGTAVGAALLGTGWAWSRLSDDRDERRLAVVTGAVGSAVLLPSFAAWTFPETKDGVPWWSWALSAVGAGGVAFGIYQVSLNGECAQYAGESCVQFYIDPDIHGAFTIAASAPLVLLPVAHALFNHDGPDAGREHRPRGAEVSLSASPSQLLLTGRF